MDKTIYEVPCIRPRKAGSAIPSPTVPPDPVMVSVPGSKSITNRALLLAALANGVSVLHGVLFSDDSRHFLACLQSLGFEVCINETDQTVSVTGLGGQIPLEEASVYVGSAGTAARFLSACLGTAKGTYHMDASPQMRRRPMAPLLDSLRRLGCEITFADREGFFDRARLLQQRADGRHRQQQPVFKCASDLRRSCAAGHNDPYNRHAWHVLHKNDRGYDAAVRRDGASSVRCMLCPFW